MRIALKKAVGYTITILVVLASSYVIFWAIEHSDTEMYDVHATVLAIQQPGEKRDVKVGRYIAREAIPGAITIRLEDGSVFTKPLSSQSTCVVGDVDMVSVMIGRITRRALWAYPSYRCEDRP